MKPILLYGCQVLAPHFRTIKFLAETNGNTKASQFLQNIASDHYERFHLKYLKWNLSVHPKASNSGCWGDSGRYPLFFEASKLVIDYFERVKECSNNADGSLLAAAYEEQRNLNLDWYSNTLRLMTRFGSSSRVSNGTSRPTRPSIIISQNIRSTFVEHWKNDILNSPKLEFYSQIKSEFIAEPYLNHITNPEHRSSVTKFRISAHNLYIERGRYERPLVPREKRWCAYCYTQLNTICIEDELHALITCPLTGTIKRRVLGTTYPSCQLLSEVTTSAECSASRHNVLVGKLTHAILETYGSFTDYFKTQDFHNKTGQCRIL